MVDWWLVRGLYCPIHWGLKKSNTGIPNKKQPGLNGMTEGFWTLLIFLKSGKADELLSWSDRHPGTLDILSDNTIVSDIPSGSIYILYYIYAIFILTFYLTFFLASILTFLLAFYLTFSLASGWGWGPAVPTGIWPSQLGPGSAHWDPALAVEVWLCPLRSGARNWGSATPTDMWSSRLRSGSLTLAVEGVVRGCRRRRRKEEAEATLIKSSDPHLAVGN